MSEDPFVGKDVHDLECTGLLEFDLNPEYHYRRDLTGTIKRVIEIL
jgi:hypothetical protein